MENPTLRFMEWLIDHRAGAVTPASFADVFERLVWMVEDNGAEIHDVLAEWLTGEDPYRVEVALSMEEAFLFRDRASLDQALRRVATKWPRFRDRCNAILGDWDRRVPT